MRKNLPPFLLGYLALSVQIFLLREFTVHFYGNEITIGFILGSWLLWGGLGSILAPRKNFKPSRLAMTMYLVILLFPVCFILLRLSRFLTGALPGEITGIVPMWFFSFILAFFISFPLGVMFVFNVLFANGRISRVYLLESVGSATAGLLVYFVLIPHVSNWQACALVGAVTSLLTFIALGERKQIVLLAGLLAFLAGFSAFDLPSQKIFWKPFPLIETKDTPYGKLQIIKTHEQVSLYNNTLLVYSYPDLAASEESVHFALLQRPQARSALLIGGGAGGGLSQALKYPHLKVDYVELNPEIIRMSLRFLPEEERRALEDERVRFFFQDGRAFLSRAESEYDAIILNLPDPSTAQINRFYTLEFFEIVKQRLRPGGVFSFRVSSAENYISDELREYLSSLLTTLAEVFPEVEVIPGDSNIFLASAEPLTISIQDLAREIQRLNLQTTFVNPSYLVSRLSPLRVNILKDTIEAGTRTINRDLVPISYFFNSVLWSTHFQSVELLLFSFFLKAGRFWLLDFPLVLFLAGAAIWGSRKTKVPFFLLPLAVMGLTTITAEIIVLIAFQTFFGYLYQKVALLFGCFMIGLSLGALVAKARKAKEFSQLLLIQSGFVLLLFSLMIGLRVRLPEIFFFLFLLALGYLGGDLFVVSNSLYLEEKAHYGMGYGLDLIGSFCGATAASSFLIPLFGLPLLSLYLLLLNSFCVVFLLWGAKKT